MRRPRLHARRILITGASSGVGLAAARRFLDEGAEVAMVARRRETMAEGLGPLAERAHLLCADVSDREAITQAVQTAVERLGGLDVLVINAGVAVFGHLLEVDPDDFDRTMAVTFGGSVNTVRAALPHLREARGTIIATASLNARVPLPGFNSYAAAKHAERGFLNTVALEEREQRTGVRVALLHPGAINTPLWAEVSSATGRQPRVPPDSYPPELVAAGLVELAVRPRPEVILGGVPFLLDLLHAHVRPVGDAALAAVDRWYRSGTAEATMDGAAGLWESPDRTVAQAEVPERDSLLAALQLGRRFLPSPFTGLRLVAHGLDTARTVVAHRDRLFAPVPETGR